MKPHLPTTVMGFALLITVAAIPEATAQVGGPGEGIHTWPDTLTIMEVTGTVLIDDAFAHPLYYLDEDGDQAADYHLSFGPWWYAPDGVERPEAGETVTVSGALHQPTATQPLATVVVFDLDGLQWRVPIEYGLFGWNAEPFWPLSDDTLTVTGTVFVDTTYYYDHYYLDVDGDTLPEYRLGFGPDWYVPDSGATRPEEGDVVTVFGILHERDVVDLLTVIELEGVAWRPLGLPAPWAGGWMARTRTDSTRAYCMNNRQSWIDFPPGNFGNGMGGPNWPDSMFVQFWEIHPDSLPGMANDRIFAGYHVQIHDRDRTRLMDGRFGGNNGMLRFEMQHQIRIRYYEDDLAAGELNASTIAVWAWDATQEAWMEVEGATLDADANTVVFLTTDLAAYYALAAEVTGVATVPADELPNRIRLDQNYPNPFNPVTTIPFAVEAPQRVTLEVFDALGRRVAVLVDEAVQAGAYTATFDASGLPSGVYVYRLAGAGQTLRRELVVVK